MKILFTGTSSFTGYWLIRELVKNGHHVYAICQKNLLQYEGIRKKRLECLQSICDIRLECSVGSKAFFDLIQSESSWDLFCHHAAQTRDYKSHQFDYVEALSNNTLHLPDALKLLQSRGCNRILLTGSAFEPGEGGTTESRGVSPYGLSKGLTFQVFKYFAQTYDLKLGKFVIPNPFGPYEEARFTTYLMNRWLEKKTAIVNTPAYVRDNIHVDLLAKDYQSFANSLSSEPGFVIRRPSGYVETQGEFTRRFAREMSQRLSIVCPFELAEQTEFLEPLTCINTDRPNYRNLDWDEKAAWDALANYYQGIRT